MSEVPKNELIAPAPAHLAERRTVSVLTVAYDGAPFSGFARQPSAETVQGSLETALGVACRRDIETVGAGRTDAGVHALRQVVSYPAHHADPDGPTLLRSLNALVSPRIVVSEVRCATGGFSARFDAVSREYRYRIVNGSVPPLFLSQVAWWVRRPLDVASMREAASTLLGEHDFRSFCVGESAEGTRTVRQILAVELFEDEQLGERSLVVRIVGNAFLHSMVRTIVGSLVEVGVGRRSVSWINEALAARDRAAAGPTSPAQGLTLWGVEYPERVWLRD
jgi:tRNA pseudouridine38-40 synthase